MAEPPRRVPVRVAHHMVLADRYAREAWLHVLGPETPPPPIPTEPAVIVAMVRLIEAVDRAALLRLPVRDALGSAVVLDPEVTVWPDTNNHVVAEGDGMAPEAIPRIEQTVRDGMWRRMEEVHRLATVIPLLDPGSRSQVLAGWEATCQQDLDLPPGDADRVRDHLAWLAAQRLTR